MTENRITRREGPTTIVNPAGLEAMFARRKDDLAKGLPKGAGLTVERLHRLVLNACVKNNKLFDCDISSMMLAISKAAALGVEVDDTLGHAYLVPYFNKNMGCHNAQLLLGWRGMTNMLHRAVPGATARAQVVYEGDQFSYNYGYPKSLDHRPTFENETDEKITHAYAVYELPGGGWDFEVLSRNAIERIRRRSKSANNGPWVSDYAEMAKKTAIRRLMKRAPLAPEFTRAVVEDEVDDFIDVQAVTKGLADGQARDRKESPGEKAAREAEESPTQGGDDSPPPSEEDAQGTETRGDAAPAKQETAAPSGAPPADEQTAIAWVDGLADKSAVVSAILNFRPKFNVNIDLAMKRMNLKSLDEGSEAQLRQIAQETKLAAIRAGVKK